MIVHVMQRAQAAGMGPVLVACADEAISTVVEQAGGHAVLTDPDLPSGTDRVRVATKAFDPDEAYDVVVNVQGDMPALDPVLIGTVLDTLKRHPQCDIATAVVATEDPREIADPNVVKAVLAEDGRALYFSRNAVPSGEGRVYHHVGLYAYRRSALEAFCALAPSPLEKREKLEQLRALEAGMTICAAIVKIAPDGVDTPKDLERVRATLGTIS